MHTHFLFTILHSEADIVFLCNKENVNGQSAFGVTGTKVFPTKGSTYEQGDESINVTEPPIPYSQPLQKSAEKLTYHTSIAQPHVYRESQLLHIKKSSTMTHFLSFKKPQVFMCHLNQHFALQFKIQV